MNALQNGYVYDSGSSKVHNLLILYDSCIPRFKLVYVPREIDKGLCHLSRNRISGQNIIFVCIYSAYILNWSQFQGNQKNSNRSGKKCQYVKADSLTSRSVKIDPPLSRARAGERMIKLSILYDFVFCVSDWLAFQGKPTKRHVIWAEYT